MNVVFSTRAYTSIMAETTEKITTETGGLFLGTLVGDTWYVIEAIDPGPKSIFQVAYFEYDQAYTQHLINKVANYYEKPLNLIGLWHRHPGSFDQFSSTDDGTNTNYASRHPKGAISALVNIDPKFRLTVYQVHPPCAYEKIKFKVGDELIPKELMAFKTIDAYEKIMDQIQNPKPKGETLKSFMEYASHDLRLHICKADENTQLEEGEESQDKLIDAVMDDLTFLKTVLEEDIFLKFHENYLMLSQKTKTLYFAYSEAEGVIMKYDENFYSYESNLLEETYQKGKDAKTEKPAKKSSFTLGGKLKW